MQSIDTPAGNRHLLIENLYQGDISKDVSHMMSPIKCSAIEAPTISDLKSYFVGPLYYDAMSNTSYLHKTFEKLSYSIGATTHALNDHLY